MTPDFLMYIKSLFKNSNQLQISISDVDTFDLNVKETKEMYLKRLENSIAEVEKHKVSFTEEEFELVQIKIYNG